MFNKQQLERLDELTHEFEEKLGDVLSTPPAEDASEEETVLHFAAQQTALTNVIDINVAACINSDMIDEEAGGKLAALYASLGFGMLLAVKEGIQRSIDAAAADDDDWSAAVDESVSH